MSKERFLTFLPKIGHRGNATVKTSLQFLDDYNINKYDYREQSYDNAPNMSVKYKGVQAKIVKFRNLYVFFTTSTEQLEKFQA